LLSIVAVVVYNNAFIIGYNDGIISEGDLADRQKEVIGVEDCLEFVIIDVHRVPVEMF
jgi:hypothetical protein